MNKLWLSAFLAIAAFSTNAFADRNDDDGDYYKHRHHQKVRHVVVHHVYDQPQVVHEAPPVVYRERIVYRDRPVYQEPAPRYHERAEVYAYPGSSRLAGQVIGGVAGGLLGNGIGKGNGRVAATAVGAVIGTVVGGNLASSRRWE